MGAIYSGCVFIPPDTSYGNNHDNLMILKGDNNDIPIMTFYGTNEIDPYYILYSHGNATDIGQNTWFCDKLAKYTETVVISYDYSGYGLNSRKDYSENNCYEDVSEVMEYMLNALGLDTDKIILYGQSLGSGPTCELASMYEFAGVILHSPLASTLHVIHRSLSFISKANMFENYKKIDKFDSPLLLIHGTNDEVLSHKHSEILADKCNNLYELFLLDNCGHNDIHIIRHNDFFLKLSEFISYIKNKNNPLSNTYNKINNFLSYIFQI